MRDVVHGLNAALDGRYRVRRMVGEGGTASVFLADDLRHGRVVALKVLKPQVAAAIGARRFLAEIGTIASLQHPHILPLYDSGDAAGFLFYVMPYAGDDSLRDVLDREGQLPVPEAVRIGSAIAEALDYAHRRGVVHRDIKPANILLHDGQPIVADFGIALALQTSGVDRMTEAGVRVGTPQYMSPEQATGENRVGPSTDIWALGCVVYEMLLGEPPYLASTPQATLGRIVTEQHVSVTGRRRAVPVNVDSAIGRALEKVSADRFPRAREFAAALADPGFRHGSPAVDGVVGLGWRRSTILLGALAVLLLVSLVVVSGRRITEVGAPIAYRLPGFAEGHVQLGWFELGPAETGVAFQGPGSQTWYRRWDELSAAPVPGPALVNVSLHPDGRRLVGQRGGLGGPLILVDMATGQSRVLSETSFSGGNWGGDGYLYFTGPDSTIHRISDDGDGDPESIGVPLGDGETRHFRFWPLPEARTGLLTAQVLPGRYQIHGLDIGSGERVLLTEGSAASLTRDGHLVFGTPDGRIMAAVLDPETLELGVPVVMAEGVATSGNWANMSLAPDGTLAYWTAEGAAASTHELVWVTRSGRATRADSTWRFDAGGGTEWAISPDGSRAALTIMTAPGNRDIWVKVLDAGPLSRLSFWEYEDRRPRWVSDSVITFLSNMGSEDNSGLLHVWQQRADGVGSPSLLYGGEGSIADAILSPDGDWLVLRSTGVARALGPRDLFVVQLGADRVARPFVATSDYAEHGAALSPDGRWLAYVTDSSGQDEVIVQPFPDPRSSRWQVSQRGGASPLWSRDGSELFYVNAGHEMMSARVSSDQSFRVIEQEALFTIGPEYQGSAQAFADVGPDGRFLMVRRVVTATNIVVVQNFSSLVRQRLSN